MSRRKSSGTELSAVTIFNGSDIAQVCAGVSSVLQRGGAVMFGQTRDQAKLIVTVYVDGDQEKEYVEKPDELVAFLAEFAV